MQRYAVSRDFPHPPPAAATICNQDPHLLRDWSGACGVAGSIAYERVWIAEYTSAGRRASPWLAVPRRRAPRQETP